MTHAAGARFEQLVEIMRTLRGPHGCPWDREQTMRSLRPFVLEETYELLDALDRGDHDTLREELGDFLFEAIFLAQIADEEGRFSIVDSIKAITDKLIRRHPHVFAPDGRPLAEGRQEMSAAAVVEKWEDLKAKERDEASARDKTILSGVPRTLPALLRAYELGSRAAAVGFDWVKPADVVEKIEEEVRELREMTEAQPANAARIEEEMGDLLFAIVNLARKLGVEPEGALRVANEKFQMRFEGMERRVRESRRSMRDLTLQELELFWEEQKHATSGTKTRNTQSKE